MRKILMASACVAAGLALAACGSPEEAAPAATDSATDTATTEAEAAAGPAEAAPAATPAESGAMAPTTQVPAAPAETLNGQVPGGVVNPSDPVPPPPGQTATYGPRPQN